ncbi:hypothetical protein JOL62DRAFT_584531 [Phyllosticta paracitricarpa]|uniref:Uncharacterized protein n=1 Tax=Phyllosticta paracitricarpa TaxID=2016321 RepID=A0ABR1MWL3_9PEZI
MPLERAAGWQVAFFFFPRAQMAPLPEPSEFSSVRLTCDGHPDPGNACWGFRVGVVVSPFFPPLLLLSAFPCCPGWLQNTARCCSSRSLPLLVAHSCSVCSRARLFLARVLFLFSLLCIHSQPTKAVRRQTSSCPFGSVPAQLQGSAPSWPQMGQLLLSPIRQWLLYTPLLLRLGPLSLDLPQALLLCCWHSHSWATASP